MTTDTITQMTPQQTQAKNPITSSASSPSDSSRSLPSSSPPSLSPTASSLLTNGCVLTAYVAEPHSILSSASYFTRSISLFYNNDSKSFYWNEPSRRDLRESHSIPLQSISQLFIGKLSPVLQWLAVSADPERCFALQYTNGKWLELEAESESQRLDWLHVLNYLLLTNNSTVSEESIADSNIIDEVPIDPLCSLSSIPSPNTDSTLPVVCPLNLHSYERKTKRFKVQSAAPASASSITHLSSTSNSLSQTLVQFTNWLDERSSDGPPRKSLAVASLSGPNSGTHTPVPNQRTRASIFMDTRLQSAQAFSANKSTAVAPRKNSTAPTVLAKDDPRSLEGSLSKLNAGISFTYCPPASENTVVSAVPDDVPRPPSVSDSLPLSSTGPVSPTSPTSKGGNINHNSLDALTNEPPQPHVVGQPLVAVRQASLSETICNILLFYQPHARRATGRVGNFGQLSWCDSMTWTRKSTWKMPLHVNTTIYLGKHTPNFKRDLYSSLPAEKCFSIMNEDSGTSVDLVAEEGWTTIKSWLYAFDRVLRSSGFTMVREGAMNDQTGASATVAGGSFSLLPLSPANASLPAGGSSSSHSEPAPVKIVFILQSELEEHARRLAHAAGRRSGAHQRNFQKLDIEPNHDDFIRHKRNPSGGLGRANPELSPLKARSSMSPIIPKLGDAFVPLPSPSRPLGSLAPIEKGARTPTTASDFARQMSDLQISPISPIRGRNTLRSNGEPLFDTAIAADAAATNQVPTTLPQRSPLLPRNSVGALGGGGLGGSPSASSAQLPDAIGRAPPLQHRPSLSAINMNSLPPLTATLSPSDAAQVTPSIAATSTLRRFSLNKKLVSSSPSISAPTPSPF